MFLANLSVIKSSFCWLELFVDGCVSACETQSLIDLTFDEYHAR